MYLVQNPVRIHKTVSIHTNPHYLKIPYLKRGNKTFLDRIKRVKKGCCGCQSLQRYLYKKKLEKILSLLT